MLKELCRPLTMRGIPELNLESGVASAEFANEKLSK